MLVNVYRDVCTNAHPERGGLLVSDSAKISLQEAKATAAFEESKSISYYLLYNCAVWGLVYGASTSVCRWSENYAEEEHAFSVYRSQTKTFARL